MKTIQTLFIAAIGMVLTTGAATTAYAASFEGIVDYQIITGQHRSPIRYLIKNDLVRMETGTEKGETGSSVAFFDGKTGDVRVLMPEKKRFMTIKGIGDVATSATSDDVTMKETGRTETIAGHKCSELVFTVKDHVIEVWATTGLGRFVQLASLQDKRDKGPSWVQSLAQRGLFGLRMITKDKGGRELSRMEATKVESKKLDAALFEIPQGYEEFRMPGFRDLLKGAFKQQP